jgi:hypothetical protein
LLVSLLNVAVFSTVYSGGPTADDIHDDAVVPAAVVIFDFNSIPAFAVNHTVLAVLLLISTFIPAVACVPCCELSRYCCHPCCCLLLALLLLLAALLLLFSSKLW